MTLDQIEQRFCECTKLEMNLSTFPIKKEHYKEQKQETIKELSDKYGFVPTPIFLVDEMIEMEQDNLTKDSITCDFCAGCGQYSIRLLRYLYNKFQIDVEDFLKNNHYITELQAENCAALVYIFGPNINLYVGDSMNLKYSDEEDKGILFFDEKNKKWFNDPLIDKFLEKETFNSNREFLSYLFNNYKDEQKIKEFLKGVFDGTIKPKEKEKIKDKITTTKVKKQVKKQEIVENREEVKEVVIEEEIEPQVVKQYNPEEMEEFRRQSQYLQDRPKKGKGKKKADKEQEAKNKELEYQEASLIFDL